MVYVDTSVLVPLFLNEPHSEAVAHQYAREKAELVAALDDVPSRNAHGLKIKPVVLRGAVGALATQVQRWPSIALKKVSGPG